MKIDRDIEGFSLFGKPLFQQPLLEEIFEKQKLLYDQALNNYQENPEDVDNIIWLGRRTAYLGHFREAIAIYSNGIEKFPDEPRLFRHRGHRFISLRLFDLAIDDFLKAVQLIDGQVDNIEPDGMPNPQGIPVSSLQTNIWYHLGLAYFLKDMFEKSLDAFVRGMDTLALEDNFVSCGHWVYMNLRLLNRKKDAEKVTAKVYKDMNIIENHYYHKILLMYKGEITPEELLAIAKEEGELANAAIGYAVGNWFYYNGEMERATKILEQVVSLDNWATFGYIAAEADLKRIERKR
ncbi:MAG: hypothetical protein ACTSQ4_11705 [Candidatus Heimdallarchaeaceae archaeon]